MGEWSEQIMAGVRERAELSLDSTGKEMVEDIQEELATPVVRDMDGHVIERSPPGGFPWMETGNLRQSENYEILSDGPQINIINTAYYARRLNDGDGNRLLPRPFHEIAKVKWIPEMRRRVADAVAGKGI
jgi:hypothetical protein